MFSKEEKDLLLDLFHLYAPSNAEEPVLDFIKSVLEKYSIPYKQDVYGNIYCLNHKDEPLLSAHTDCVGKVEDGHFVRLIDIYPYGDDEILKGVGNIGGDDKCGVFLILLYLMSGRHINAFFSTREEIGGYLGVDKILDAVEDNEIFKSCPYCIVLDRKNKGDIICEKNGYGTLEFQNALEEIGKDFGYVGVLGGCSDMNKIKKYMNGCNLSVSYYNPHSSTEFVSLNELWNTWQYLQKIITDLPRDIKFVPPAPVTTWSGNYGNTWNSHSNYGNNASTLTSTGLSTWHYDGCFD